MRKFILCQILLLFAFSTQTLAQTATEEKSPPQTPRVGNINPADKDKYRTRYEARDNRFIAFGGARGIHLNNEDVLYVLNMGYEWEVGPTGALPLEAFGVFGNTTFYADAGLGYKHFFSDEDISPFLKGTIGAGVATLKNLESINGFSLRASVGTTFFRTSSKHLELSASYGVIMKDTSLGYPHILSLTVGFLY